MMSLSRTTALCGVALWIAACGDLSDLTGSRQAENNIAASCRNWDAMARAAAHPDAATIALHDRLAQKAADLEATAVAQQLSGAALEHAAQGIAQAQIEADDVYDAKGKYRIASQCWQSLGLVEQQHREMMQDLTNAASSPQSAPGKQTTPIFHPDMSVFTTPTTPGPSAPPPDLYQVQHGDIHLYSPDGPVVGQTTRIGSPPPSVVLVPVPVQ